MNNWLENENSELDTLEKASLHKITEYPSIEVDSEKAWSKLSASINHKSRNISLINVLKIAAVIVICFGLSIVILNQTQPKETALVTGNFQKEYILADGSSIFLDQNTHVTLDDNFIDQRILNLKNGRIHLDVVQRGNSFIVKSESIDVEVLGTSFVVDKNQNLVYVESGTVAVSSETENFIITQGDQLILHNEQFRLAHEVDKNILAWKTKELIFDNVKFKEVVNQMNEYYSTDIKFNKALGNCLISANFKNQSLKEAVTILSTILNAKSSFKKDNIIINGEGCN